MNLLYINYWSITDFLTKSTVFPNLKIVQPYFSNIYLTTVERGDKRVVPVPAGVIHTTYRSATWLPRTICKVVDVIFFSAKQLILAKQKKIDVIICRGSMGAIFGVILNRILGIPFMVESFEPHANYMTEGGTWKKNGIEFLFQKWIEDQSIHRALYLMPVAESYRDHLVKIGVPKEKIYVMPCCVDTNKFRFSSESREKIRKKLNIPTGVSVGIYVGKFGGIYLDHEAFDLFKKAYEFFEENFFLILLSPQDHSSIREKLLFQGIPENRFYINRVEHDDIPEFMSASDFAFSLVLPIPSMKYCSPVKNGEYWASGLPILLPEGVGDDDAIANETGAGAVYNIEKQNFHDSLRKIQSMLNCDRSAIAEKISPVADRYRNFEIIDKAYKEVLTNWQLRG